MFEKEKNYYYVQKLRGLGVEAIYTTKDFDQAEYKKDLIQVHGVQTHSKNIYIVDEKVQKSDIPFDNIDGMITNRKDVVLYTKHADCLALYFYDMENYVIGLCHSGWKGSYEEIGLELIKKMQEKYKTKIEKIIVGIGIGISEENYEVSESFYENFKRKFSLGIIKKSFIKKGKKYYFDNENFNAHLMEYYGVIKENIIKSELCTYNNENFHSFRRDKEKSGRNRAYISILK
ncbi:MAG: peptidoglycan editing factor PgeF [Fusobacteriaceae bacterium]